MVCSISNNPMLRARSGEESTMEEAAPLSLPSVVGLAAVLGPKPA